MKTRISLIRSKEGLSQDAFGKRIGVTGAAISRIESGDREPSEPVVRAICHEFNVSYDWLTEGVGPMYVPQSDSDIELITRAMEGKNENKKQLIRIMADMPDELLDKMMEYLESKFK